MAMKWFRFYTEALNSKKVQDLTPVLFKFWVNLLALANNEAPRGSLPDDAEVAFLLRLPPRRVVGWMAQLRERGLVDAESDTNVMHNWEKWQMPSDDAAERMAKKRRTRSADVPNKFALDSDTDTEAEEDTDSEAEAEQRNGCIFRLYEQEIGAITPAIRDTLLDWDERIPSDQFAMYAFEQAATNGARTWRYVETVLKRLEAESWPVEMSATKKADAAEPHALSDADLDRRQAAQEAKLHEAPVD